MVRGSTGLVHHSAASGCWRASAWPARTSGRQATRRTSASGGRPQARQKAPVPQEASWVGPAASCASTNGERRLA
eukprot:13507996-Alexandrium_andersonii.AAC.1